MIFITVVLPTLALVAWLAWSLRPTPRTSASAVAAGSIDRFSADQYLPLEKLLSERDYEFLATQPGYKPSMARKLRADRRRICIAYLKNLTEDFDNLHAVATQSAAQKENGAELLAGLLRQKILFRRSVLAIRLSLALSAVGIGHVNPSPAIEAFRMLTILAKGQ